MHRIESRSGEAGITAGSPSGDMSQDWRSPVRVALALAELAIIGAGVVFLFASDGRWWVILAASLMFLVGVMVGMLALVAKL
jgi:membrane protein YdbS with pleckstrin-like domain